MYLGIRNFNSFGDGYNIKTKGENILVLLTSRSQGREQELNEK